MSDLVIRQLEPRDFSLVYDLQREVFPLPFPQEGLWDDESLTRFLDAFPEGQFVAEYQGKLVGSATNIIVSEKDWNDRLGWDKLAGETGPLLHDPEGTTLYGLDISVAPSARRIGIAKKLYEARFALTRQLGLRRFGVASRLPGLAQHLSISPEEFAAAVNVGELVDQPMTPFLRIGMRFVGVIHSYMTDIESRNCSALLEWIP